MNREESRRYTLGLFLLNNFDMNKEPIAILSTDKHLQESNALELLDLAEQEINLAKSLGVTTVIWLGDIFDSRLSQRQELLTCLTEMIGLYHQEGISIYCIPGNHDKTDYESDESFLTQYRYHPGFTLFEVPTQIDLFGVGCYFLPFYSQDVWLEKFEELPVPKTKKSILFSHTAVQGSINNDGKVVNNRISLNLFKKFGKVLLGHYHDAQQPGANVFHLPSTRQNNFGEDEEKGFTVLFDDTSFEFIKASFVPYKEIKVDVLKTSKDELLKLAKTSTDGVNVRITLVGDQQAVKAVNKKVFTEKGISVKTKYTDVEVTESQEAEVVQELSGTDVKEKFKAFCEEKGYDYPEGYKLLKQIMKWQE